MSKLHITSVSRACALIALSIIATPIQAYSSMVVGHIDVLTDSPNGGSVATNYRNKHSEGYNITNNDGLGRAVDGYFHNYSDANGVSYVDLFELEPRRDKASMLSVYGGLSPCDTTEDSKQIEVDGKCIEAVEGELNRAYDILSVPPVSEVNEPTGSGLPLADNVPFIVILSNADLSTAGTLQIGCRTWPVRDYQDMITTQLESGIAPNELDDAVHGLDNSLVFTLADILNDTAPCPSEATAATKGVSTEPTLRVSFNSRSIRDLGIHGTRSQCVLGLHQPEDKVCYADASVLAAAEGVVPQIVSGDLVPDDDPTCASVTDPWGPPAIDVIDGVKYTYLQDPSQNWHITRIPTVPGQEYLFGYRWRNGALTVQLIDARSFVGQDCTATASRTADCPLQHPDSLPKDKSGLRKGGTFAQAFTAKMIGVKGEIVDRDAKAPNDSGLLYEAAVFWHYGRMADDIRANAILGSGYPSSTPCYGGDNYHSRLQIEASDPSCYPLTSEIPPDTIDTYVRLHCPIQAARTEEELNPLLLELAEALASSPYLALFASYCDHTLDDSPDLDGDGIVSCDNCPVTASADLTDTDADGIGDVCDNCPEAANLGQADADADGIGDACDICVNDSGNDEDGDALCADVDNCPLVANIDQLDFDSDGLGDLCDSDADNDTFELAFDCNDFDPAINPSACDIKRDGIDQNCDGVDRTTGKSCGDPIDDGGTASNETGKACSDNIDNDSDGFIDCDDTDCSRKKHCRL